MVSRQSRQRKLLMSDDIQRPPLIEPQEQPQTGSGRLIATVGAATAALLIGTVATFEGKSNDPYPDIVHIETVCYGETRVAMHHYTDAQCQDMLAGGLVSFAKPVLQRNPELAGHTNQLAAAVSLAYNIGAGSYAHSSVARDFSAGQWRAACNAFLSWDKAGGHTVMGLLRRRQAERTICLEGLS